MALVEQQITALVQELRDRYESKEIHLIPDNVKFAEIEEDLRLHHYIKFKNLRSFKENGDYGWLISLTNELSLHIEADRTNQLFILCQN